MLEEVRLRKEIPSYDQTERECDDEGKHMFRI